MSKINFLLIAWIILLGAAVAQAEDIAVIVNAKLSVNSLSREDVKSIYLGEVQFLGGARVKPVDQKDTHEIRRLFLKEILSLSKVEYTKHWMHLVFLEGTHPPVLRDNSQAVIETVQEVEG